MADPADQARLSAIRLAEQDQCSVLLPAGSGKTELIVAAAAHASRDGGRQLVLTHTHAGVHAIRVRASERGASTAIMVSTIDSLALTLTRSFRPAVLPPSGDPNWPDVEAAATEVVANRHVLASLRQTYDGLFVDEYQDCSDRQHELILAFQAGGIPTRVLGDPVQSVFGFSGSPTVDWATVGASFPDLELPAHPWRWHGSAGELGAWLAVLRDDLCSGRPSDLGALPAQVTTTAVDPSNHATLTSTAQRVARDNPKDSTAVIRECQPPQYRAHAKGLRGFQTLDAVGLPDVAALAQKVDEIADDGSRTFAILDFLRTSHVFRSQPRALSPLLKNLKAGKPAPRITTSTSDASSKAYRAADACLKSFSANSLGRLLDEIRDENTRVVRPDSWYGLVEAADHWQSEESLSGAVQVTVDRRRHLGRRVPNRVVSTPLLLKGLEFDHVVLTHVDEFTKMETLYVAATRAKKSLTICTHQPTLSVNAA